MNHCEKMFDSSAYDEARPTPILGCDCDEWASHFFSGDLKNSAATDALEFRRIGTLPLNVHLFVVKVEQYVV